MIVGIRAQSELVTSEAGADKVMENSRGFVNLVVYGKTIQALVDTGVTHNFMTTRLAREAGLTSTMEVRTMDSRSKVAGLVNK